jgi:hypothetical protein
MKSIQKRMTRCETTGIKMILMTAKTKTERNR